MRINLANLFRGDARERLAFHSTRVSRLERVFSFATLFFCAKLAACLIGRLSGSLRFAKHSAARIRWNRAISLFTAETGEPYTPATRRCRVSVRAEFFASDEFRVPNEFLPRNSRDSSYNRSRIRRANSRRSCPGETSGRDVVGSRDAHGGSREIVQHEEIERVSIGELTAGSGRHVSSLFVSRCIQQFTLDV